MIFGWIKKSALLVGVWHVSSVVTMLEMAFAKVFIPDWYNWVMIYALPPAKLSRDVVVAVWESAGEIWHTLIP